MTDNYNIKIPVSARRRQWRRPIRRTAVRRLSLRLGGTRRADPDSDVDVLIIIDGSLDGTQRAELTKRLLKLSVTVEAARCERHGLRPLEVTILDSVKLKPRRSRRESSISTANGCEPKSKPASCQCRTKHRPCDIAASVGASQPALVRLRASASSTRYQTATSACDARRAAEFAGYLHGDERNVLLTYCRMWYTLANGDIVSKIPPRMGAGTLEPELRRPIEVARLAYLGKADDSGEYADAARLAIYFEEKISELLE